MLYLILKSLHVLSVVLFLGNIITGVFWKFHARIASVPWPRARRRSTASSSSDRWFTMPGVVAIIITGVCARDDACTIRCCVRRGSSGR